jgi:MFS transporter, Spinster family, sphingosine-1-phosphate transporter
MDGKERNKMQGEKYQVSKGWGITILVVLSILQLSDWADRSILAISMQAIKTSFNMTDAEAGMLPSLLQAGIAIFTLPAAMLADRFARRKLVMGMALVWSTFTMITGLAGQVWHMMVARFMVGTGEAGYQPAGQTWLGLTFPKEIRARILAVFMMCQPLGIALGLFLGGVLLNATHDWRTAFFIFGIPGIVMAFIVIFLPDYKTSRQPGEGALSKAYFGQWRDLFKIKSYWLFIISSTLIYFMVFGYQSWIPTLVMRAYNADPMTVGTAMAGISLIFLLAPLAGYLADRWQERNKAGRPLFLVVVSFLALVAIPACFLAAGKVPFQAWLLIYAAASLVIAFAYPVLTVLGHDVIPAPVRSTGIGIQITISQLLGGVSGPFFVGAVSDASGGGAQGITTGLLWTIPVAALSIITTLLITKYYAADSAATSDLVLAER